MTTKRTFQRIAIALLLGASSVWMSGCGLKKCQEAPTQAFTTFTEQEWRLVETVPSINANFSNTNFLIFQFGRNFQGQVFRVENNDRFETPVLFFRYNVDPQAKVIVTQFESQTLSADGEATGSQSEGDARYVYSLGRDFTLYDQERGIYYRFVPFTGVVDPDSICEF